MAAIETQYNHPQYYSEIFSLLEKSFLGVRRSCFSPAHLMNIWNPHRLGISGERGGTKEREKRTFSGTSLVTACCLERAIRKMM